MIIGFIVALAIYAAIVTLVAIHSRREVDAAVADALWWEKYSTRDGGIG